MQSPSYTAERPDLVIQTDMVGVSDEYAGHFALRSETVDALCVGVIPVADLLVATPPIPQQHQQSALCPVAHKFYAALLASLQQEGLQGSSVISDNASSIPAYVHSFGHCWEEEGTALTIKFNGSKEEVSNPEGVSPPESLRSGAALKMKALRPHETVAEASKGLP